MASEKTQQQESQLKHGGFRVHRLRGKRLTCESDGKIRLSTFADLRLPSSALSLWLSTEGHRRLVCSLSYYTAYVTDDL